MEQLFIEWLKEYGYIVLFVWSILEGEMGLIMAGIFSHTGDMSLSISIFVAGVGGFVGDQIYFYIGRFNKRYIHEKLRSQRRKFAIAHLLLKKYGWPIIFIQRYMYGMRTVIPMAIGLTKYSARQFAFINLISAWFWAALTIIPAYYYGEEILSLLRWIKAHWFFAIPLIILVVWGIIHNMNRLEKKLLEKRRERQTY
ncbi:MAG: DedA family protein [Sulfuricurvum sp.]|uniref:DedA family protein n=1 Tax=Sulfuricurvum sp. TaxID=2025608 RepID=UPI002603E1BE|nr:DedA family protein [Sulfuricurvum sp.]MDD2839207.1 DedA family protein [Sulfuricurvum sp.]MDD3596111.1 DedA family protein [Sulfuricurvum sp.]MDD4883806.1 DedA family protein [Sulfuricurvum sp.]